MELYLNIFLSFCMFVMGSLFGSFFSLATYRLPRKQDIVATRSYCPTCKHRLGFFDLIPILSYIIRGGKCKYCKEKISPRYLLLEVTNGIVFLVFYLLLGYNFKLLFVCLAYAILFVLIGSNIMKSKMTEEEEKEVQNMTANLKGKKGVYVVELLVAMIFFAVLLGSAFTVSRNYTNSAQETRYRSNAIYLATHRVEIIKATEYSKIDNVGGSISDTIDNVTYNTEVTIEDYRENGAQDLVKVVTVKVTYPYKNETKEYSVKTLKGKVS